MKFNFKKGDHYPVEWWKLRALSLSSTLEYRASISALAHYTPGTENDINKLFGYSLNLRYGEYEGGKAKGLLDSIRVGWTPHAKHEFYEVHLYVRNNGALHYYTAPRCFMYGVDYSFAIGLFPKVDEVKKEVSYQPFLYYAKCGGLPTAYHNPGFLGADASFSSGKSIGLKLRPHHGGDEPSQKGYSVKLKRVVC